MPLVLPSTTDCSYAIRTTLEESDAHQEANKYIQARRDAQASDGNNAPAMSLGSNGMPMAMSIVGASVAACKIPGIRAAICHDAYSAHQGVEHDDMNVLCLGSEIIGPSLARDLVERFLAATFIGEGRYLSRLEKVAELERLRDD